MKYCIRRIFRFEIVFATHLHSFFVGKIMDTCRLKYQNTIEISIITAIVCEGRNKTNGFLGGKRLEPLFGAETQILFLL